MSCRWITLLLPLGVLFAQVQTEVRAGDVILRGGWLFDSIQESVRRNTGILVRNGEFLEVDARLGGRDLSAARAIDLADDEYILPGLFDLHAHYAVDLFGEGRVDEYTVNPLLFLANGVTSTFPAGEVDPEGMMEARKRIDNGQQSGPRILNSGPYFGSARPGWNDAEMDAEHIRADVRKWAALGIKGAQGERHSSRSVGGAHRGRASPRSNNHGAPRFRLPENRQSSRRHCDGDRPGGTLHGRRRDHLGQARISVAGRTGHDAS